MRKEEIYREDGRYLIYYWFDDEEKSSETASGADRAVDEGSSGVD